MRQFCVLILIVPFFTSRGQLNEDFQIGLSAVRPDYIKASMTFLADDLLEGRQPGTRGFEIAAKYVESEFIGLGLVPGANGGYVQKVPLKKGVTDTKASSFALHINEKTESWDYAEHFLVNPYLPSSLVEVNAPLVFVGFGVSAPELGYNDYEKFDVKGKIVVYFNGAPSTFPSTQRAYYSSAVKLQEAVARGAVGVVTLTLPRAQRTSWEASVRRLAQGTFKWVDKNHTPVNAYPELKASVNINPLYTEKLFSNSGKNLQRVYENAQAGKPQAFALKAEASIKVVTKESYIESSNLVGYIPGSDSVLKEEYITYVAHVDHFGIGAPVKNDSIFNGAHDNASGVSILLAVAQAFRELPVAPKRSILFVVVTAEEYGLLGSDYFATNPTIDGKIVANISFDMPFFFHPLLDIVPYGAQHSTLSKHVDKVANIFNLKISPDPFPEQVVFIRSDHFSFIRKGIPALFIKSGFMTIAEDTVDRSKTDVTWRSTTYHTPQDDMKQDFNFEAAAMHAKLNFLIGYFTANDVEQPAWNKGDFFGKKFGKQD